jgi:hypothetical protein
MDQLCWTHHALADLFCGEGRFDDARVHIEHATSHTVNNTYLLGWVVELQAWFWYKQRKFEEARSTASRAADVFERLGATKKVEDCRALLRRIESERQV